MAAEAYLRASGVAVQAVSIIVLALMVVINATNITCRAVLGVDLEWTQEVSVIAAMVIYFFSFALIAKTNSDIRVEFIVAMLPRSWQRWLGIVSRLAVLGFQAAVLWLAINTLGFVSMFQHAGAEHFGGDLLHPGDCRSGGYRDHQPDSPGAAASGRDAGSWRRPRALRACRRR